MIHAQNDVGVVVAPDSWLDPDDRPRAGLDTPLPLTKKMTAAGIFAENYAPTKTLTFDLNDDVERIVTFYFTSWHGGGYDLQFIGKYMQTKVTFFDENGNVLLSKNSSLLWNNSPDSNGAY